MDNDFVGKLIRFLETHNGRDKICRTLQYGSRFLAWYLLRGGAQDTAKKYSSLESSASMSRKIFRLGKSLQHFQSALTSYVNEKDALMKLTNIIQQLSLAIWLIYDHIIWANKLGLIKSEKLAVYSRRSNIFWLVAMVMGIIKSVYQLQITLQTRATNLDSVKTLRKKQTDLTLELIKNILDVPIPLTALNQTVAAAIPTGIVGLFGTITSIIGVQQAWSKQK